MSRAVDIHHGHRQVALADTTTLTSSTRRMPLPSFCPVKLFSRQCAERESALAALLLDPHNNLKVFVNGELSYTGHKGGSRAHGMLDLESLLSLVAPLVPQTHDSLVAYLAHILDRSQVLEDILRVQRLDLLDIEAIAVMYDHVCAQSDDTLEQLELYCREPLPVNATQRLSDLGSYRETLLLRIEIV